MTLKCGISGAFRRFVENRCLSRAAQTVCLLKRSAPMILAFLALSNSAVAAARCPPANETQVRDEFRRWMRAYEAHDLAGSMAIFSPEREVRISRLRGAGLETAGGGIRPQLCPNRQGHMGSNVGSSPRFRKSRNGLLDMARGCHLARQQAGSARGESGSGRASSRPGLPLAHRSFLEFSVEGAVSGRDEIVANPRRGLAPGSYRRARARLKPKPPGSGSAPRSGGHI